MQAIILPKSEYWAFRRPFDQYLPETISAESVEAELEVMQQRFRDSMSGHSVEGEDWGFPGHYQHVRVFYVYVYKQKIYTPRFIDCIQQTMQGFESDWIGEFECYEVPGHDEGDLCDLNYQGQRFVFRREDEVEPLVTALGLTVAPAKPTG